ncbi:MAG: YceI family protein [Tistlia sp.]|uniref:YceI family protein n=1 Tax=Tistlia sp. TaxID=3057121 RepID=UPI0034A2D654
MLLRTTKAALVATLVAAGTLAGGGASPPAGEAWTIDPAHADVVFRIDHLGYSATWGRFGEVTGTLAFEEDNPEDARVEAVMAAASIDTNHAERDRHLGGDDFFKVDSFPEVTFRSTAIEVTGESSANITGQLTMLGVTRPVVLAATLNKVAPHPRDAATLIAGFSATTSIQRSDWGITYGVPVIGDQVDIFLDIEATKPAE